MGEAELEGCRGPAVGAASAREVGAERVASGVEGEDLGGSGTEAEEAA